MAILCSFASPLKFRGNTSKPTLWPIDGEILVIFITWLVTTRGWHPSDPACRMDAWFIFTFPTLDHPNLLEIKDLKMLGSSQNGSCSLTKFKQKLTGRLCHLWNNHNNHEYQTLAEGKRTTHDASPRMKRPSPSAHLDLRRSSPLQMWMLCCCSWWCANSSGARHSGDESGNVPRLVINTHSLLRFLHSYSSSLSSSSSSGEWLCLIPLEDHLAYNTPRKYKYNQPKLKKIWRATTNYTYGMLKGRCPRGEDFQSSV